MTTNYSESECNVLVTAIGSASADIVIKSLHAMQCTVIGTDIYPKEWIVDSRSVDAFFQVPRTTNPTLYISKLLDICKYHDIAFIIPLTDLEVDVLNENRENFDRLHIKICMSSADTIRICRDKRRTSQIIGTQKICNVIPEINREYINQYDDFPVICKKINGRSSNGMYIFDSREELQCFINNKRDDYLIQPYLKGKIITADILRNGQQGKCIVVAREELLRTTNGMGLTVKVFYDEVLYNVCREIAELLDIDGCVNFEFIKTYDGKLYFLECNPRFSGGVEFSVLSGYDFVKNHLRFFRNEDIDAAIMPREQIIARKYKEYIM